jgi:hypothetical protein
LTLLVFTLGDESGDYESPTGEGLLEQAEVAMIMKGLILSLGDVVVFYKGTH